MARYLLEEHKDEEHEKPPSFFGKIYLWIDTRFNGMRDKYHGLLLIGLKNPKKLVAGFLVAYAACLSLIPF
ncbi:hypothetical protein ABTA70_20345, partial [Acinetobacter baumannii]